MKILILHNFYQQSGGERVAVEAQASLLRARGHEVTLYTRDNAEITSYGISQRVSLLANAVFSQRTYREVKTLLQIKKPDVAHIHNVFPLISPAVYSLLKKAGIPIVQTLHNFRFMCPNGLFYINGHICERCKYGNTLYAIPRRCYRHSYILSALYALSIGLHRRRGTFQLIDCFIALASFTAQKLTESGLASSNRIRVLGNFLPDPLPEPGSFEKRESYVVYLGRLTREKGIHTLLEATAGICELELKVAGDGPQAEALRLQAREQGLKNVQFLGRVVGSEKWSLLKHATATVVPSVSYENMPFTALEGAIVGTPIIASDLGSLPYIVENGQTGLLFRPGDSEDLRHKLLWLIEHPEKALIMGRHARQITEQRYSADTHYRALMAIYTEMIN